jgi:transposase-like protein
MNYHVMSFEQCPRCSEFENDHKFKNCGFTVDNKSNGATLQHFECTRCNHRWTKVYESRAILVQKSETLNDISSKTILPHAIGEKSLHLNSV